MSKWDTRGKKWEPQVAQPELKPVIAVIPPDVKVPEAVNPVFFGCILCSSQAGVLYEGTSYCRSCLKEKLRLGR